MARIARGAVDLDQFGQASRRIISEWDLDRFADGLDCAMSAAVAVGPRPLSVIDDLMLAALLRR